MNRTPYVNHIQAQYYIDGYIVEFKDIKLNHATAQPEALFFIYDESNRFVRSVGIPHMNIRTRHDVIYAAKDCLGILKEEVFASSGDTTAISKI